MRPHLEIPSLVHSDESSLGVAAINQRRITTKRFALSPAMAAIALFELSLL